ncbi:hypothetical protein GCM10009119_22950 [Algoriphagus jejuensis]|uniref:D-alanyl-D-alanine dipeptidase n=2 Tax=Algoriphagus jejuensis TaxID=419934 RepID=A0ABN1N0J5_9BACT
MNRSMLSLMALAVACSSPVKSDQEIFSEQQRKVLDPVKEIELDPPMSDLEQKLIAQGLVDVETVVPGVRIELKYSTTDNFFGKDVYGDHVRCYLQPEVADRVKKAQELLQKDHPHLTLLIYDGVRPLSVQQILWDSLDKPDSIKPLYVADPKVGGLHNFGVAVDLTIFDTEADSTLDMGTAYDYFGYPAYPDREKQMLAEGKITKAQVANREILRKVMKGAGFTGVGSEWWHFNAFSRKEAGEKFDLVK